MNSTLKKEIIFQVLKTFGLFQQDFPRLLNNLTHSDFKLSQTLAVQNEQGLQHRPMWGSVAILEDQTQIKILITDLSDIEVDEIALILQLEGSLPFAFRISTHLNDEGTLAFKHMSSLQDIGVEKDWIEASTLYQARVLVAVESLNDVLIHWEKLNNYQDIYQILIDFLKWDSEEL